MKSKTIYRHYKNSLFTAKWMRRHLDRTTCKFKKKVRVDDWEDLRIQESHETTKKV